jgi:hypothetical protein
MEETKIVLNNFVAQIAPPKIDHIVILKVC